MSARLTEPQHRVVKQVARRLNESPESLDQDHWPDVGECETGLHPTATPKATGAIAAWGMSPDDTVVCIAEHIVWAAVELGIELPDAAFVSAAAQELAGLTNRQAEILFYECTDRSARNAIARVSRRGRWRVRRTTALIGWVVQEMAEGRGWPQGKGLLGVRFPARSDLSTVDAIRGHHGPSRVSISELVRERRGCHQGAG